MQDGDYPILDFDPSRDAVIEPSRIVRPIDVPEHCLTVEMEAAAFLAAAQFRGMPLAQMLYAGDDVSGADWDTRDWVSRATLRDKLFSLAAEACLRL